MYGLSKTQKQYVLLVCVCCTLLYDRLCAAIFMTRAFLCCNHGTFYHSTYMFGRFTGCAQKIGRGDTVTSRYFNTQPKVMCKNNPIISLAAHRIVISYSQHFREGFILHCAQPLCAIGIVQIQRFQYRQNEPSPLSHRLRLWPSRTNTLLFAQVLKNIRRGGMMTRMMTATVAVLVACFLGLLRHQPLEKVPRILQCQPTLLPP